MSDISKTYNPESVESKWYPKWIENHCFKASVDPKKPSYAIMIPPPNVTGVLHMGHILNNTIQDILVRRARQQGKSALWLPGTDHAGIATQTKVEKELQSQGTSRREIGREAFTQKACEWRDKHGGIIFDQLKALGVSCDWSRNVHTLDPDYSHAVLTAFVHLYKKGYIYRGKRMVNWCPKSLTALSDEEVTMQTQKGKLYKMRYEIVEHPHQYVEICTTRPETLMGDTAIAVNPEDDRYKHLIGLHVWRPFPREQIPIVGDPAVEKDFGTGVLKVTPAHDRMDFEIGQRHNLPIIDVMNPDGTLNELAGADFQGMDRFKARDHAAEKLKEMGYLVEIKDYDNNVGYSERGNVPIEPRLSEQWFLKYPRIQESKDAVSKGIIKFWPERWSKTYLHWLENIQDWCISRQLWWGHRIPVWYKKGTDRHDPQNWHVSVEGPSDPENWEQDEDVLDTWASSWLWPFATLGWPDQNAMKTKGFHYFYPTEDLVTGPDIIFFWVARMIMAGLEFLPEKEGPLTDEEIAQYIPFKNVYFTGIIRDAQGRKMSKSLGNSPEPLDLIKKFGTDGLRLGIMSIAPQGQDVLFQEDRIEQGRNFCNKLWNACRFRQMSGDSFDNSSIESIVKRLNINHFDADDHAILGRLLETISLYNKALEIYEFNTATQEIYRFFWTDFCDWYVEVSKSKLKDPKTKDNCLSIQDLCIRQVLLMLHPFTPFITEELWHNLGYCSNDQFIQSTQLDTADTIKVILSNDTITLSESAINEINQIRDFVTAARSLKAEYQLASKKDLNFFYKPNDKQSDPIALHKSKLMALIGAASLESKSEVADCPAIITQSGTLYLDLSSAVDPEAESQRLEKELDTLKKHIAGSRARLSNEQFVSKAPPEVLQGAKDRLKELEDKEVELLRLLDSLKSKKI